MLIPPSVATVFATSAFTDKFAIACKNTQNLLP